MGVGSQFVTETPDFYSYSPVPLEIASAKANRVIIEWPDGHSIAVSGTWLRENIVGHSVDPLTREGIGSPSDHLGPRLEHAGVTADGTLSVDWDDGCSAEFDSGWLRSFATGGAGMLAGLPTATPWVSARAGQEIAGDRRLELPLHIWPPLAPDGTVAPAVLRPIVDDLIRYGVVRLVDGPTGQDDLESFAVNLGPLRDTNFGRVWDVMAKVDPNSTAYTGRPLVPHTDLPTRERPPGFQALHCVENTCEGGLNQMADGLAIVRHLEATEPDYFEALTTLRWVFMSKGRGIDHRWTAPVVEFEPIDGAILIRGFSPVRAFPDMPVDDVDRSYAAISRLHELGADPAFQIQSAFQPGQAVIFDNRRMLHARSGFDPSAGIRRLRGCYFDPDDIRSVARVLARTNPLPDQRLSA
ncbi:MAG: hypothetical protein HKN03_07025 [Acidimicrobiales bacterium]|nr:hypothetical protein [Acidimicrobiales bacterium]